ncbi:MAG TPA: 50S ribosomal protein L29 [Flavobacteriales bacterium]|jgi:large subunit ribosomal protein L29|nr:50S ribosomal protein L29 [Flavobacteriales bacterium]|tara:strand:- start:27 stop:236 length:210 start_codon:yes stop_codon:yes gene_type:complete
MKSSVLIEMPDNEIRDLLLEERDRLAKMKMSHAVSPLENPHQIRFTKRTIARIMTEIRRREIAQAQKNK